VSLVTHAALRPVKKGVAMTGSIGLDGRIYAVLGLFEKIRGAAACEKPHFIVPTGNVVHQRLVQWDPVNGSLEDDFEENEVQIDGATRSAVTVYEARTVQDVLELCVTGPGAFFAHAPTPGLQLIAGRLAVPVGPWLRPLGGALRRVCKISGGWLRACKSPEVALFKGTGRRSDSGGMGVRPLLRFFLL
jgi:hypothetical protein